MLNYARELFKSQLEKLKPIEIRTWLGRERICFTKSELLYYCMVIMEKQDQHVHYKVIYNRLKPDTCYQNFMKNINKVTPLFDKIFRRLSRIFNRDGKTSKVDSSLISCTKSTSIREKHWQRKDVVKREDKSGKPYYVAGVKIFASQNEFDELTELQVKNIRTADINWLKQNTFRFIGQTVLADRAFNSMEFSDAKKPFEFISPPRTARKEYRLTAEQYKLYKKRWTIEIAFQKIKDENGEFKLAGQFRTTRAVLNAEIYWAAIKYNCSVWMRDGII